MARQSKETRLLREYAYCKRNNREVPKGLLDELHDNNLLTPEAALEAANIRREVFPNG
jgi:hypothetical protein